MLKRSTVYLALVLSIVLAACTMQTGPDTNPPDNGDDVPPPTENLPLSFDRDLVVFNAGGGILSDPRTVSVTNDGANALELTGTFVGDAATQFALQDPAPFSLGAGESKEITIVFNSVADVLGPKKAELSLRSGNGGANIALGGLQVRGQDGNIEPSLQWIFDTYDYGISTGDEDPTNSKLVNAPTEAILGDEIPAQTFVRADPALPVTLQVLAAFGPSALDPVFAFGFYDPSGGEPDLNEVLAVPNTPAFNGQRLEPVVTAADGFPAGTMGVVSFEPTAEPFGFYSTWPKTDRFAERTAYSEDARNTFDSTMHHVRVYPLDDMSYIVVTDESNGLNDFNDSVVLVTNIQPVAATDGGGDGGGDDGGDDGGDGGEGEQ